MNAVTELERDVWEQIKAATEKHDTGRLAHFSAIAAEIEAAKRDWLARFQIGLGMNGSANAAASPTAIRSGRRPSSRPDADYTGQPIRGFEFDGHQYSVTTYKELLLQFTNLLRNKFGDTFEREAVTLGGRKRRYFSRDPRELKYAHELEGGGLFVETNLNANLIVKICYGLVRALGHAESNLKVW